MCENNFSWILFLEGGQGGFGCSVSLWAGWGLLWEGPSMDVAFGGFFGFNPLFFLGFFGSPCFIAGYVPGAPTLRTAWL